MIRSVRYALAASLIAASLTPALAQEPRADLPIVLRGRGPDPLPPPAPKPQVLRTITTTTITTVMRSRPPLIIGVPVSRASVRGHRAASRGFHRW